MSAHPFSTRRGRAVRAAVLARSRICWLCGQPGADTVDHIIPVSACPDLAFEPANLRPAHGARRFGASWNYGRGADRAPKPATGVTPEWW